VNVSAGGARKHVPSFALPAPVRALGARFSLHRFLTPDVGARFALLLFGVATLTAARTASFIGQVPSDSQEPHIPPLIWLFHLADALFLPGVNRLPGITPIAYLQAVALALALLCFFLAARSTVPEILRRLYRPLAAIASVLAVLLILLNLQGTLPYGLVIGSPMHYGNDAISVTSCGTDAFLAGKNPYSTYRVVPCLSTYFNAQTVPVKTTPLQEGAFKHTVKYPTTEQLTLQFRLAQERHEAYPPEFESYYSYPSGSFILPAPAVALHLQDLSIFYLVCYLAIAALAVWGSTGVARWAALIAIAANAALWPTVSAGATDSLYALLVLLAWILRDRRWASSLLLGLAVVSRQQAWFFTLFYGVLIDRTLGRREVVVRGGIIGVLFAVMNLPYLIASPLPWLHGVLGPMTDPMFPRGTGIIALSIYGAGSLPLGPRLLYLILETIGLLGSLWYYWRICRQHPATGLVLAPLALFFAWRSLYSYFLPLSLLVLYPALAQYSVPKEPTRMEGPGEGDAVGDQAIVAA
jgi:hypothetical protein